MNVAHQYKWDEMVKYVVKEEEYKGWYCNSAGLGKVKFTNGIDEITSEVKKEGNWLVNCWLDIKQQIDDLAE